MKTKTIGIVLETLADAQKTNSADIDTLYHWREPEEIAAIVEAIALLGHQPIQLGTPKNFAPNITNHKEQIDLIFNLSVGFQKRFRLSLGPALYELSGIPYSGADPYTKMVSQNKHLMKSFLDKLGFPTPAWTYIDIDAVPDNLEFPPFPVIVKPAYEGSSIGIHQDSVVCDRKTLLVQIKRILEGLHMPVIVEAFIQGKELKVGILGNKQKHFIGLHEDVCENGDALGSQFLSFDSKTFGHFGKEKRDLHSPVYTALINDCKAIYDLFVPLDYGTFDVRMDENGRHYFLEFNADATLHPARTLSQCCQLHGVSYPKMIQIILEAAFERWQI